MYRRMARQARRASYDKVVAEVIAASPPEHTSSPGLGFPSPLIFAIPEGTAEQAQYKVAPQVLSSPYHDEQPAEVLPAFWILVMNA